MRARTSPRSFRSSVRTARRAGRPLRRRRPEPCLTVGDGIGWLRRHIDRFALTNAARAAIVMPGVFLLADKVIDDPDSTLFAAFGSFAILVLADFGGPRRVRLVGPPPPAAPGTGLAAPRKR